jgi:dihydrofolate reductase
MNANQKIVFSRTLDKATWSNTTLLKGNLAGEIRKLKKESEKDMTILGSGSLVSQLTQEGLIDEFQIVLVPVVLGKGRTMFDGVEKRLRLKLTKTRAFPRETSCCATSRPLPHRARGIDTGSPGKHLRPK